MDSCKIFITQQPNEKNAAGKSRIVEFCFTTGSDSIDIEDFEIFITGENGQNIPNHLVSSYISYKRKKRLYVLKIAFKGKEIINKMHKELGQDPDTNINYQIKIKHPKFGDAFSTPFKLASRVKKSEMDSESSSISSSPLDSSPLYSSSLCSSPIPIDEIFDCLDNEEFAQLLNKTENVLASFKGELVFVNKKFSQLQVAGDNRVTKFQLNIKLHKQHLKDQIMPDLQSLKVHVIDAEKKMICSNFITSVRLVMVDDNTINCKVTFQLMGGLKEETGDSKLPKLMLLITHPELKSCYSTPFSLISRRPGTPEKEEWSRQPKEKKSEKTRKKKLKYQYSEEEDSSDIPYSSSDDEYIPKSKRHKSN